MLNNHFIFQIYLLQFSLYGEEEDFKDRILNLFFIFKDRILNLFFGLFYTSPHQENTITLICKTKQKFNYHLNYVSTRKITLYELILQIIL